MRNKIFLAIIVSSLFFINCKSENQGRTDSKESSVKQLTDAEFKKLVFNYELNKEWKFEGDKPVIIDFYADWCAPCRQLSPLVDSIADEYSGKIAVYKVDTEKEKMLAQGLGITGLPTLLFIPAEGMPRASMGFMSRENMLRAINEILLINN
jgi:thioredoxin 1